MDERSSDSSIGCDNFFFFFRQKPKICSGSNVVFCGLTFDLFLFISFPVLKERQTPQLSNKSLKVTKNVMVL